MPSKTNMNHVTADSYLFIQNRQTILSELLNFKAIHRFKSYEYTNGIDFITVEDDPGVLQVKIQWDIDCALSRFVSVKYALLEILRKHYIPSVSHRSSTYALHEYLDVEAKFLKVNKTMSNRRFDVPVKDSDAAKKLRLKALREDLGW